MRATPMLHCLIFAALLTRAVAEPPPQPTFVEVYARGRDGYPAYRIPSMVTTSSGTLLAFAEGRASLRDHAENDIVLKRSLDNGNTWEPLSVVAEDGANALNNPTAIVTRPSGRVLLVYQRYQRGFDEHNAAPGLDGPNICRIFTIHSDDEGVTWSKPAEITAQAKRPSVVTSTAAGPGCGIQLKRGRHNGRILIPFNQGPYGKWSVYAVMSDDGGNSWCHGKTAQEGGKGYANEVQFVELANGDVMLNARNQGGEGFRKTAISADGGETWSPTELDRQLPEPFCQAGLIELSPGLLLFSNPNSQTARTNGTIRLSEDDGKTWKWSKTLYAGGFSYSSPTVLKDGAIGCLFEKDGATTISFARFTTNWVMDPAR